MASERRRNGLEWTVFSVGAVLTLLVVGFLVAEAFQGNGTADLRVAIGDPLNAASAADVDVTLRNAGDAAALDVVVEVCDSAGKCGTLTFPQVPAGATREGRLAFEPGTGDVRGRVVGYRLP